MQPRCSGCASSTTPDGLFRGTEITFDASEIGLDTFGQNIPNPALIAALEARAEGAPGLIRIDAEATAVVPSHDSVTVTTDWATHSAPASLSAATDGARFAVRPPVSPRMSIATRRRR